MSLPSIYCPGGSSSQSGVAVATRYTEVNILDCGGISDVPKMLDSNSGPYAIPIWNSNQGEIEASEYVWNLIEEAKIKIFDIWPKSIEFWFIVRTGDHPKVGIIGSVIVARTQCSKFLLAQDAIIKDFKLTNYAFDAYKLGEPLDGVLVAPGYGEGIEGFNVVSKKTANANNFTSFVRLSPSNSIRLNTRPTTSWLTGVTMGSLAGVALDEGQASFFDKVFSNSSKLEDIPKLIFVFKRTAKVGLLFEGDQFFSGDFLDAEEIESGDILIHENVGELEEAYTKELDALITNDFPELNKADFILHYGIDTFLFACPPLGMYTHGYEKETVEPVVRFYINKVFEFIDNEAKCSVEVTDFFDRYKKSWEENRSKFIEFTVIDSRT